jgi:nitrate/nitrite transport system ATP-binding protein
MKTNNYLRLEYVGHRFRNNKEACHVLHDINLTINKGEIVSLVGHSGCGKSTLLHLIAGLERPTQGVLLCAEKEITCPGRDRAIVFQNHNLLPWLSCFQNVYLAVERAFLRRHPTTQLKAMAEAALAKVGLQDALDRYPGELSAGMRQRVGIARALAIEPSVLLMDEPFNALDTATRAQLQDELMALASSTGTTIVLATHDVDESVMLSDRIVLLSDGPASTIHDILPVSLPRPRRRMDLLNDARYGSCRAAVLGFLHQRRTVMTPERGLRDCPEMLH